MLDYESMGKYFSNKFSDQLMIYSKPQQADAIRYAILAENEGCWLDVDTLVMHHPDSIFDNTQGADVLLLGDPGNSAFGAFILSLRQTAFFKEVTEEVIGIVNAPFPAKPRWDYIAKPFMDRIKEARYCGSKVVVLNWLQHGYIAETAHGRGYGKKAYQDFWFESPGEFGPCLLEGNSGLIGLHNSWTPARYKQKSKRHVLYKGDEMMSKYIRYALRVDVDILPPRRKLWSKLFMPRLYS